MNSISTKILLGSLLFLFSCSYPAYLPKAEKLGVNPYGAEILVIKKNRQNVHGEFLSFENDKVIILLNTYESFPVKIISIPVSDIKNYYVKYYKPENYGWTIPTYTLLSISHGFFAILTFPLNMLVSWSIIGGSLTASRYTKDDLSFYYLKLYSRFPQGIPKDFKTEELKTTD